MPASLGGVFPPRVRIAGRWRITCAWRWSRTGARAEDSPMRRDVQPLPWLLALPLCACATALITADAPKTVRPSDRAVRMARGALHLDVGDRVEFAFKHGAGGLNVHYHEGNAVDADRSQKTRRRRRVRAPARRISALCGRPALPAR
jgi:hypothetical protein